MTHLNRLLMIILGLVTTTVGVLGALISQDVVSAGRMDEVLPFQRLWNSWREIDWASWRPWALASGALAIALLALVLFLAEFRRSSSSHSPRTILIHEGSDGRTSVRTGPVRERLEHDLRSLVGINSVSIKQIDLNDNGAAVRVTLGADPTVRPIKTASAESARRIQERLANMFDRQDINVELLANAERETRQPTKRRVV